MLKGERRESGSPNLKEHRHRQSKRQKKGRTMGVQQTIVEEKDKQRRIGTNQGESGDTNRIGRHVKLKFSGEGRHSRKELGRAL